MHTSRRYIPPLSSHPIFFLFLIHCICSYGFNVLIAQPYGSIKKLRISEIQLFNQGYPLPMSAIHIQYYDTDMNSSTGDTLIHLIDEDLTTYFSINHASSQVPTVEISSGSLFFDEIVIHADRDAVYGAVISVSQDYDVFWNTTVTMKHSVYIFSFHEQAIASFPIKIVDTFSYNGEPAALFHVRYLYSAVNEFLIAESWYTNSGKRKPFLFFQQSKTQKEFAPYMDKIRFVVIDEVPSRPSDWIDPQEHFWILPESYDSFWSDHYQRQYIKQYVDPAVKALFICVDADEVIDTGIVAKFRNSDLYDEFRQKVRLEQRLFYYNFKWLHSRIWLHPFVLNTEAFLAEPNMIQARAHYLYDDSLDRDYIILRAGWHLSYFMSVDDVVRKIESVAHREMDTEAAKSRENVIECMLEGRDLYNRTALLYSAYDFDGESHLLPDGWEWFQEYVLRLQGLTY